MYFYDCSKLYLYAFSAAYPQPTKNCPQWHITIFDSPKSRQSQGPGVTIHLGTAFVIHLFRTFGVTSGQVGKRILCPAWRTKFCLAMKKFSVAKKEAEKQRFTPKEQVTTFQKKLSQNIYITLTPVNGKERKVKDINIFVKASWHGSFLLPFPYVFLRLIIHFMKLIVILNPFYFPHLSPGAGAMRMSSGTESGLVLLLGPRRSRWQVKMISKTPDATDPKWWNNASELSKEKRDVCPHF